MRGRSLSGRRSRAAAESDLRAENRLLCRYLERADSSASRGSRESAVAGSLVHSALAGPRGGRASYYGSSDD